METAYLEQNRRDYEVTQSFSLALLDPSALADLRETGRCDFAIPEIMFDLFYPGQYRRIIKSARVSLPCVTGPYTNISAKLTLTSSRVRRTPSLEVGLTDVSYDGQTSIATSNAQNDGGVFELNFRDERYLPFEGAGAISEWGIELPSAMRMFDYDTISDVIIHISYTAKDDGNFKTVVENQIVTALTDYAAEPGLYRLLSLKHEFPNAFYRLLNPSGPEQTTVFELTGRHFPHFLAGRNLGLSAVGAYLKPKGEDAIETGGLTLTIDNSTPIDLNNSGPNIKDGMVDISGGPISPIGHWIVNAGANDLDKETLDDVLILLKYSLS
jgi:hypothetical protein